MSRGVKPRRSRFLCFCRRPLPRRGHRSGRGDPGFGGHYSDRRTQDLTLIKCLFLECANRFEAASPSRRTRLAPANREEGKGVGGLGGGTWGSCWSRPPASATPQPRRPSCSLGPSSGSRPPYPSDFLHLLVPWISLTSDSGWWLHRKSDPSGRHRLLSVSIILNDQSPVTAYVS
jgi:hypothetical protein